MVCFVCKEGDRDAATDGNGRTDRFSLVQAIIDVVAYVTNLTSENIDKLPILGAVGHMTYT